jgi:hypothetical protein
MEDRQTMGQDGTGLVHLSPKTTIATMLTLEWARTIKQDTDKYIIPFSS